MNSLSISIVLYKPEKTVFVGVLESLAVAAEVLCEKYSYHLLLVVLDNSVEEVEDDFELITQTIWKNPFHFIRSNKNLGYGAGHNRAIKKSQCDYHLILNPDVLLDPAALLYGVEYLQAHPQTILVSPQAYSENGDRQYLCKSYPSVFDLFLRGFTPSWCQAIFAQRLADYELRGKTEQNELTDVPIASGCFMLMRKQDFDAVGGFSEKFFLYFEDFDLSIKLRTLGHIAYIPEVKIVHFGGQAAKKGIQHIILFGRSMCLFFHRHGWCLY
jgi:GT2 family glycosyltransferase